MAPTYLDSDPITIHSPPSWARCRTARSAAGSTPRNIRPDHRRPHPRRYGGRRNWFADRSNYGALRSDRRRQRESGVTPELSRSGMPERPPSFSTG